MKEHAKKCAKLIHSNNECNCDGYHTFDELYEHRITLYIALCREYAERWQVWKSRTHSDGTTWAGWFVLGIMKEQGEQITYHLPEKEWDNTEFAEELEKAPYFDNHTPDDVLWRIRNLSKVGTN